MSGPKSPLDNHVDIRASASDERISTRLRLFRQRLPMSLRFMPHIIYSLALTSFSMHLLYERRAAEEDRVQYSGKISILETLVQDLEQGQRMDSQELKRLRKLAGISTSQAPNDVGRNQPNIGWKEVLLGKPRSEQTLIGSATRDQGDWEKRRCTLVVIAFQLLTGIWSDTPSRGGGSLLEIG